MGIEALPVELNISRLHWGTTDLITPVLKVVENTPPPFPNLQELIGQNLDSVYSYSDAPLERAVAEALLAGTTIEKVAKDFHLTFHMANDLIKKVRGGIEKNILSPNGLRNAHEFTDDKFSLKALLRPLNNNRLPNGVFNRNHYVFAEDVEEYRRNRIPRINIPDEELINQGYIFASDAGLSAREYTRLLSSRHIKRSGGRIYVRPEMAEAVKNQFPRRRQIGRKLYHYY
jgi:hypothetical protein